MIEQNHDIVKEKALKALKKEQEKNINLYKKFAKNAEKCGIEIQNVKDSKKIVFTCKIDVYFDDDMDREYNIRRFFECSINEREFKEAEVEEFEEYIKKEKPDLIITTLKDDDYEETFIWTLKQVLKFLEAGTSLDSI